MIVFYMNHVRISNGFAPLLCSILMIDRVWFFEGLLRCGKSCRLRWINYLRADLKRGNITKEEEETIVKLHNALGNR